MRPDIWRKSSTKECLLVITGAFAFDGGIAASNRLAIQALLDAGYDLTIMALSESREAAQVYEKYTNITFHAFSGDKIVYSFQVWRAILRKRYRLVYCDHVNLAALLMPLTLLRLVKYAVRLHGIEVWSPQPSFEGKIGLNTASRCITSTYTYHLVIDRFPHLNIEICDLSLSPEQVPHEIPAALYADETFTAIDGTTHKMNSHVILQVGRMAADEQYKGQDTLIRAMSRILALYPDAQLILAGRGDDMPRLRALAQAQPENVQAAIFMPGFVSSEILDWLYSQCFLFAMPSRGEGFGFVYIEAMSWGKPCLGSRSDAAQYIIRDGETGLLVNDPADPAEVSEQIIKLFREPETAAQMGTAGRKRVQDYFTYEHFKARFLKMLDL
jgi:phosphatidyl-myo-inositol dimannoside synthase